MVRSGSDCWMDFAMWYVDDCVFYCIFNCSLSLGGYPLGAVEMKGGPVLQEFA